jgi:hypothetical protein
LRRAKCKKYKSLGVVQDENFLKEIKFIGFEYTAVADRSKVLLNEKRARFQFEVLEKEHKWLADEEADKMRKTREL